MSYTKVVKAISEQTVACVVQPRANYKTSGCMFNRCYFLFSFSFDAAAQKPQNGFSTNVCQKTSIRCYYGRTLSDASMLCFADVFFIGFFMAALVGQTAERIFTKLSHVKVKVKEVHLI